MSTTEQSDGVVKRLPWKEFLKNQIIKLVVFLVMVLLVLAIITLSRNIAPDASETNPSDIVGYGTIDYWLLIITSSALYLLVLFSFGKVVFFDHNEEFGITNLISWRSFWFFSLVIAFISAVYLLLDVALANIYLETGPVNVVYLLDQTGLDMPGVEGETDRLAYSYIRSLLFLGFYVSMLIFPLVMFLIILTRLGRSQFTKESAKEEEEKDLSKSVLTFFGFVFALPVEILILIMLLNNPPTFLFLILLLLGLMIALWWVYQLLKLFLKTAKFTAWLSYTNFLLVFPIAFLFYVVPVVLWTGWDLLKMYTTKSTLETIHTELNSGLANTTLELSTYGLADHLGLMFQTVMINAVALYRIIQLDFVVVVGVAAVVIGLAEGYSVVAIFKALWKGVSVARSGTMRSATSSPRLVVYMSRFLMLGAWTGLAWESLTNIYKFLVLEFPDIPLPEIDFPSVLGLILALVNYLGDLSAVILPLAVFLVPLYFIIASAFKFLSVTIVIDKVERTRRDPYVFFLLISSAFVLITTNILEDIAELVAGTAEEQFLPFAFQAGFITQLLPWASKVFDNLEAVAFVGGLIWSFGVLLNEVKNKLANRQERKEEEKKEKMWQMLGARDDEVSAEESTGKKNDSGGQVKEQKDEGEETSEERGKDKETSVTQDEEVEEEEDRPLW